VSSIACCQPSVFDCGDPFCTQSDFGWMSTEADYHAIPGPSFLEPQETAAELLARTFVAPLRSGVPVIDQHTGLRPGHILELVGGPATAKSELLLQVWHHVQRWCECMLADTSSSMQKLDAGRARH